MQMPLAAISSISSTCPVAKSAPSFASEARPSPANSSTPIALQARR
jgi:hypothetical protein